MSIRFAEVEKAARQIRRKIVCLEEGKKGEKNGKQNRKKDRKELIKGGQKEIKRKRC